LKKFFVGL